MVEEDENPFVGSSANKQSERRALLSNVVRDEGGKSSKKKLYSVALFMAVLIIGTLSLLTTKWRKRVSGGTDSSVSVASSDDDCTEDYTDYEQSSTYCNEASAPVLEGADCVAYFSSSANHSTPGSSEYASTHRGYTFYFASVENRDTFDNAPHDYAPAYGGFCAFGLSGEDPRNTITDWSGLSTVPSDPNVYTIYDGRLYMFRGTEARGLWLEDADDLISGADSLWGSWFGDDCDGFYDTGCFM